MKLTQEERKKVAFELDELIEIARQKKGEFGRYDDLTAIDELTTLLLNKAKFLHDTAVNRYYGGLKN